MKKLIKPPTEGAIPKIHMLPHHDERPAGSVIDTIVIHSLYAEAAEDPLNPASCIDALDSHKVASHYLIARSGDVWLLVEELQRAWHAGESIMPFDGRRAVNDFSIGIELIGLADSDFTVKQYQALAQLAWGLLERFPISSIVGHEHIAPLRKTDPGRGFDWGKLRELLAERGAPVARLKFAGESQ